MREQRPRPTLRIARAHLRFVQIALPDGLLVGGSVT